MSRADSLLVAGDKAAARAAFEEARTRCVRYAPVPQKRFLSEAAPAATDDSPLEADVRLQVRLQPRLGEDIGLTHYALYLDGQPVRFDESRRLASGQHRLDAELYLEARAPGIPGGSIRMDISQTLVLPRAVASETGVFGGVVIDLIDRGGAGSISDRLKVEAKALPFQSARMAAEARKAEDERQRQLPVEQRSHKVMLAPKVGEGQRLTPRHELMPDWLNARPFWTLVKLCVTNAGDVDEVTYMKEGPRDVFGDLTAAMFRWKYRPYSINGRATAFCTPVRVQGGPDGR